MITSYQETAKLLLHIERNSHSTDLESVNSVELHELINMCMSFVIKRREELRIESAIATVSSA